jgi:hypothetical protein
MTLPELALGPGSAAPAAGMWEIISGKFEGVSAGFTIRDSSGQKYFVKFDSEDWPEMATSAEAISSRIFHAAGYNVPKYSVISFPKTRVYIGLGALIKDKDGEKRCMTVSDLDSIWTKIYFQPNGEARANISEELPGDPIGPFGYHGRRVDDPNDRVMHEHRRELRGLRVISSWINDTDRRPANSLDVFLPEGAPVGYIKHYLMDMGATLGSNSKKPHLPRYGKEYLWTYGNVIKKSLLLGFHSNPWEELIDVTYPTIGYFESDMFSPGTWVPSYPNPAFQWCTDRDGYWGAKIVTAFSDDDIEAIVETGGLTIAAAKAELIRVLIERRNKIGQYWFARINPLDKFNVVGNTLHFEDLAVTRGISAAGITRYRYRYLNARGQPVGDYFKTSAMRIPINNVNPYEGLEIQTERGMWKKILRVYIHTDNAGVSKVVRIDREP